MNTTIFRTMKDEWMMLGASLRQGGYFNFAGVWGTITKVKRDMVASFEDETGEGGTNYYYVEDKGKNWPLFLRFEPLLTPFELWDSNDAREGTIEQERKLYNAGMLYASYSEKITALGDLKEVIISEIDQMTQFPPHFNSTTYLYGSLVLALPAPLNVQTLFKKTFLDTLEMLDDAPRYTLGNK